MDDIDKDIDGMLGAGQSAAVGSVGQNPDKAAEAVGLSETTGVPAATIHQDLDGFKARAQQDVAGHIVANNPMLGHYLATNPMAGPVSNDDLGTLDAVSQHATELGTPGIWSRISDGYKAFQDSMSSAVNSEAIHDDESSVYNYIDSPVWKGFARNLIAGNAALNTAMALPQAAIEGVTTAVAGQDGKLASDLRTAGLMLAGPQGMAHGSLKMTPEALAQAVESASAKAQSVAAPYLREGRPPPVGVDPVIDSAHLQQTQSDLAALNEALKQSQASTTRDRAPSMYLDFIRQHTDRTIGVSHDAVRELYGNKVPEEGDGLLGFVPDLPSQLLRAAVTGNDIQIPIPEYMTHVDPAVHSALEPNIRTREGGITQAEADVLAQKHQDVSDRPGFDAYHFSPHDFDAFDMSKVGTGEGLQVEGHGMYVSDDPNITSNLRDQWKEKRGQDLTHYDVRVNADPESFLDRQKSFYDHPDDVQQKLLDGGFARRITEADDVDPEMAAKLKGIFPPGQGMDIYNDAVHRLGSPKAASEALAAAGIPGIRFKQGPKTNHVIFDPAVLEIRRKNDQALAATYKAAGLDERMPSRQYQTVEEPLTATGDRLRKGAAESGGDLVFRGRDEARGVDVYHDMGEAENLGDVQKDLQRFAPDDLTRGSSLMVEGVLKHLGIEGTPTHTVYPDHPAIDGNLGYYHPATESIALRHTSDYSQMLQTTNHEALHAAFFKALNEDPDVGGAVSRLLDEARASAPGVDTSAGKFYGLTNEHEFISEAFTNPEFQEHLSKTPVSPEMQAALEDWLGDTPASKIRSLWDAFLLATRKAFGLPLTDENMSLLDATMKVGDRLTAAAERQNGTADRPAGILAQPVEREGVKFANTRGMKSQFHGTSMTDFSPQEGHYTSLNYYGQGLYSTDAVDVAYGYSKRGSKTTGERNLHQVWTKPGVKIFDGEKPLAPEEIAAISKGQGADGYIDMAIDNGAKNLREVFDDIRDEATADGHSADTIQEIFEGIQENLINAGYGGMSHTGGLRTGTPEHQVVIHFNPESDVNLSKKIPFDAFKQREAPAAKPAEVLAQPLPPTDPVTARAAALGMNRSQAIRYRELINARDAEAFEKQKAQVIAAERKRQTTEWKKNEVTERKDAARDVPLRPDIHADTLISAGEKLDTDALSPEQRAALGDGHTRNGLNPDDLAQHTGFATGDEMIAAVAKLREDRGTQRPSEYIRDQIATETSRRMEEKYGNLDQNVIEAAKEQVLSKTQFDLLHAEAEAAAGGELPVSQAQLKANVKKVVGELKLKEISSDGAIAAAGRAGRAIEDGLLKNDPRAAFEQRMRQYNALLGAKEMAAIEKAKVRFDKTMKVYSKREVPGASQEYVNQMHGLMLKLGQGVKRSVQDIAESVAKDGYGRTETDPGGFPKFLREKEGIDGDPRYRQDLNIPDFLRDPEFKTNLNDLTADQFAQVDRAFKSLIFNARNENKVIRAGEKIDYLDARNDLITQLKEVLPGSKKPIALDNPTNAVKITKHYWWSSINLETMLNRFDRDDPLGKFNQTLVRMYTEAAGDRERMLIDYNRKVRDLGHFGDMDKRVTNELFRDPESGQAYEMKRRHVLGVLQNVGNESNMLKLTKGYGISAPDVMEFLRKNTTKEDWDRAQALGNIFEELFEHADNMSHNVSGVGIEKIAFSDLTSPHGDTYKGWYNPVAYDKLRGEKTGKAGSIDDLEGGFYKATTPQTYTKTRTGYIGQMQLNLDIVPVRMKQMIHDITTREAVQQLGKFFYDPKFKNAIRDHYGAAQADSLEPFLRDFANAPNFESAAERAQNQLVGAMASNMVTTAIGLNPGTVLKHGLGALGKSLLQQPIGFTKALVTVLGKDAKTGDTNWARALDLSDECKRRMRNFEDTVTNAGQTISLRGGGEGSHWKSVRAFSQYVSGYPIGAFDMLSSVPTFLASYDKAIAEGHDIGQAKFLADRDVRTTHGSSILTNRPEIARSRSAIGRTFAGFYGVFSENLQKQYQTAWMLKDAYGMAREGDFDMMRKSIPKLAGVAFTSTIMMALVEHAVDSDDKSKKESWGQMAGDLITKSATSSLIGIRDLASAFTSDRDPGGNLLSGFEKSVIDPAKDVRKAIIKGDMKEIWGPQKAGAFLKRIAIMTGALTGVGNAQLGRIAQFLYNEKKEHPRGARDMAVGLWHGTLKNHRKGLLE